MVSSKYITQLWKSLIISPTWNNGHNYLINSDLIQFQCRSIILLLTLETCLNQCPQQIKHIHIKNSIQKQDNQFTLYTSWLIDLQMSPESTDNMNLSGDINSKQFDIINKKRNRKQITKTDPISFTLIQPSP